MTYTLTYPGNVMEGIDFSKAYGPTDETGEYFQAESAVYDPDIDKTKVAFRMLSSADARELLSDS